MLVMNQKTAGVGLLVAVIVCLDRCGQRGLRADVLPGETQAYEPTKDAVGSSELPIRIPTRLLKPDEKPAILAKLRKAAAQLGSYEAELYVETFTSRKQNDGPSVKFLLRAWGRRRWRVVDVEGDGGLFVSASSLGIDGGLPWRQADVHIAPGPDAVGPESPLVVPEWLLDERYLEGVEDHMGLAKFSLSLEGSDFVVVEVSADLATGTVRHVFALTKHKRWLVQHVTSFRPLSDSIATPEVDRERKGVRLVEAVAELPRVRPRSAKR